jgi:hypothetical protein
MAFGQSKARSVWSANLQAAIKSRSNGRGENRLRDSCQNDSSKATEAEGHRSWNYSFETSPLRGE